MGEVYYGFFEHGELQGEIGVYTPDAVPMPPGWPLRNGLDGLSGVARTAVDVCRCSMPDVMPSAEAAVRLAAPRLERGEQIDPADAVPLYVRNKAAKTVVERMAEEARYSMSAPALRIELEPMSASDLDEVLTIEYLANFFLWARQFCGFDGQWL